MPQSHSPQGSDGELRAALLLVAALTVARLIALFGTPLELYPDEAQYWLWSRTLDFGYYSKPPMIAWAIWATTAIGGDAEAWVRLSACLFQAGATLVVFLIGRRLYGPQTGLAAAALYGLMPGIQLSALVAATDAPLLFFLGVTILAYVNLLEADGRRRVLLAAGVGAALGLAFLSKYAAVYFVVGLAVHLALSRPARAAWTLPAAAAALAAFAAVLAPNLAWNATHGFATFQHTAANAAWSGVQLFNVTEMGAFVGSQFGVFGPIPLAVLLIGVVLAARRRQLSANDLTLLCFSLPPLLIVTGQAFISRANANWSGAGYLAGAILVAAWLMRWRARRWLIAAVAIQGAVAAFFLAAVMSPALADKAGLANGLKRARGWSQTTELILDRAAREPGLTAIAVNNRFLFYAMSYYGRDRLGFGAPPLASWLLMEGPRNQAETTAPLTAAIGRRVLMVSYEGWRRAEMQADFAASRDLEIASVWLDRRHKRKVEMFVGEGFAPRPRDAATGLPTPP
ncbi:MAG: 4-amino-4-deoxy-L-arabinose transferase [Phenylobacterium sp. RIFCSPHIGHO2_01_FULL_69_31]|uniref:ArnT family glycosyltransferase n=1 Tax=Phenylobacterium sp. RIFCSPHIGHO2_01_FULL_69_31 TaxID=1801944 RepID=UPI0008D16139|nr:glycosyltransferase family 39 protein [Phenylobacterium sp. RIFCSPHIGHO2_01_FULL_69_31]OHB31060.1 MAG: 4-amino-4-deoxy-L-arabinose transferase [Phenylobacterium sp. RIFCSPHIGHO2_01_FULL_69_31]